MAWNAYVGLLFAWVLFVPAALRAEPGVRGWARAAALIGLAAALYESWMTFVWGPTVTGPIRIDILLLFPLLIVVYALAAMRLYRAGWTLSGAAGGVVALAAAGVMVASIAQSGREMARLDTAREEGNRLLFEAKFADRAAYESYFGAPRDAGAGLPFGHWVPDGSAPLTRLVVGGDGRAYFFFGWDGDDAQYGSGAPLKPADSGSGWTAQLVWPGVGERRLELAPPEGDAMEVRVDGKPVPLKRVPPPLLNRPREETLRYLGAFSGAEPLRQHARVAQLWLWQDDDALYAVGVFRVLLPGRRADFVRPAVLGRGVRDGDVWRFTWTHDDQPHQASVRLLPEGQGVEVEPTELGARDPWPLRTLAPGAIFHDEIVDLASRASQADWQHWFDTLLVAH